MIAFMMKVLEEIRYRTRNECSPDKINRTQALLFLPNLPSAPRRSSNLGSVLPGLAFHTSRSQRLPELTAELRVPIVQ